MPFSRQFLAMSRRESLSCFLTWLNVRDTAVTSSFKEGRSSALRRQSQSGILTGNGLANCPSEVSNPFGRAANATPKT